MYDRKNEQGIIHNREAEAEEKKEPAILKKEPV